MLTDLANSGGAPEEGGSADQVQRPRASQSFTSSHIPVQPLRGMQGKASAW